MKRFVVPLIVVWLAVAFFVLVFVLTRAPASLAMAEYSVSNLTCGSCVTSVQQALSRVDGVGQVEVDVTRGRAKVEFDPQVISAETIAGRITEADYPAQIRRLLSADEYRALGEQSSRLSARYVGRIGESLISRDEFEASGSIDGAPAAMVRQWNELVEQEVMLQDAARSGVVVSEAEVRAEIEALRERYEGFDDFVRKQYRSPEKFFDSTRRAMIINRHVEDNVLDGPTDGLQKRQRLNDWFRELKANTEIAVFDNELEAALSAAQGGCGSGCCG